MNRELHRRTCFVIAFFAVLLVLRDVPGAARQGSADRAVTIGDRMYPRDEASSDPAFAAFRSQLLDAVRRRRPDELKLFLAPSVNVEFSSDETPEQFVDALRKQSSEELQEFWSTFERALTLGSTRVGNGFCAPYVYTDLPAGDVSHPWMVVTARRVHVRAGPKDDAPVLAALSYEIVREGDPELIQPSMRKLAAMDPVGEWVFVTTKSKVTGFVRADYVWSAGDSRFCFDKTNGEWKLRAMASSVD